jgi:putative acetyltransferase
MKPDELAVVRRMSMTAFGEDEQIGRLLDLLRESWAWEDQLSFVAIDDNQIVGHVLYTHAFLDAPPRLQDVLVLSPVGVIPERQRQGIGSALIRHSLGIIERRTEPVVFLEGIPTYYPRFGFRPAAELGFTSPSVRTPPPAFMAYLLPAYETWMTGTVVYADAFWRADSVGLRR